MKEAISAKIENELLEEVIRPAITTNTLHFDILIKKLKRYYNKARYSFPDNRNWERLIDENK